MNKTIFSFVALNPTEVRAGDSSEFVIRLIAGTGFTAGPSRIIFDMPGTLGFSRPSVMHQEDSGYMDAYISNPSVTYTKRNWDMELDDFGTKERSSWRGMAQRLFVLDLSEGIVSGDTIEVHWGDVRRGFGPGTKVASVVPRPDYRPSIHVRYFEGVDQGVPDLGRSFGGYDRPEPDHVVELPFCIKPRDLQLLRLVRKPARAMLLPLDMYWNVCEEADADDLADIEGAAEQNSFAVWEYREKDIQIQNKAARGHNQRWYWPPSKVTGRK